MVKDRQWKDLPPWNDNISFSLSLVSAIQGVRQQLDPSVKLYGFDFVSKGGRVPAGDINLDALLNEASPAPLSGPQRSNYSDKMLYIYTSGTTGLPKAVGYDFSYVC